MIINVIPKGEINCWSFISRLLVIRLDVHQIKRPTIEYQTASRRIWIWPEEMEMMVALNRNQEPPCAVWVQGSEVNLHTFSLFLNFLHHIFLTLFFKISSVNHLIFHPFSCPFFLNPIFH